MITMPMMFSKPARIGAAAASASNATRASSAWPIVIFLTVGPAPVAFGAALGSPCCAAVVFTATLTPVDAELSDVGVFAVESAATAGGFSRMALTMKGMYVVTIAK